MSVQAITWAYSQQVSAKDGGSIAAAKFILVTLANYSDTDGYSYPSEKRLCQDTGLATRTVRRALRTLEENHLIKIERNRGDNGRLKNNTYYLQFSPPATMADGLSTKPPVTMAASPPATMADQEPSEELEPSKTEPSIPRKARERDELWDTVCQAGGINPFETMPQPKAKWVGSVVAQLKQMHATPAEVRRRASNWPVLFPGPNPPRLTIGALAKWWQELDDPVPLSGQARHKDSAAKLLQYGRKIREAGADGQGRSSGVPGLPSGSVPPRHLE